MPPHLIGEAKQKYMDSRKFDLEELYELWRKAPNSYWRDEYAKTIDKILRETGEVRQYREELVMAMRVGDRRHIKYCQERLNRIRQNQTHGREI